MKDMIKDKICGIIVTISFVFNILIFAPLEIYYSNKSELWFNVENLILPVIILAILTLAILFLIFKFLKGKNKERYITIIFIINLALYIQGNFLNFGYKALDGETTNWKSMIVKGIINTIIWLVIIAAILIYRKKDNNKRFKTVISIVSLWVLLIQIITLFTVLITNQPKNKIITGFNNNNIFNLSKKENIMVIMSDTFEATYMNQILEEYPEYKEKLKDFTYFDNCTGTSFYTYSAVPMLLTGVECKVGESLTENMNYSLGKTNLYKTLIENGYTNEIYAEKILSPSIHENEIQNLNAVKDINLSTKTKVKITEKMYKYVLYRYLPHFFKSNFELDKSEFNNIKSEEKAFSYKQSTYTLDDVAFNKALTADGITLNNKQKSFKFYQMYGVHTPYNTTLDIQYDYTREYGEKDVHERRITEVLASLNILCNYIEEMKKVGVYDQTTIIFLADHGYDNRFYTNLMVKKAGDSHDFKISSAPVSLLEDLVPTILNIATKSKDYGKDFFDYVEGEKRTRRVFDYTYESTKTTRGEEKYKVFSKIIFQTEKEAKDKDSFYIVEEEYYNQEKELLEKYEFNKLIKISEIEESPYINLVGFNLERLNIKIGPGWNISNNTYLEINNKKTKTDVEINLFVKQVYNEKQKVNFKIDGKQIYSCTVKKDKDNNIKFTIPKEIWNKYDKIKIEMEFPDAELSTIHAAMMTAIQLEAIKITN